MARYEGHDDYKAEEAELRALAQQRQELAGREIARRREVERTAPLVDEATRAERQLGRARDEARDVRVREKAVQDVDTAGVKANTAEIERNARARRDAARASVDFNQALRGGRDPMFAQAHAMAQANEGRVTQYAMRRDLPGVGSRRAAAMQAAVEAGMVPETGARARHPLTRSQAASLGAEQAEADYQAATRELARVRRRQSATDEDRLNAIESRDEARTRRDAARREVTAAEAHEQSTREASAARRELARKERAEAEARGPGTELIRHPTEFGQRQPGPFGPLGQVIRTGTGAPYLGQGVRAEFGGGLGPTRAESADRDAQAAQRTAAAQAQAAQEAQRYAEAMGRFNEANARAEISATSMTAAQDRVRIATRNSAVEFGTLSQQMTRHGALTSEFITAAARGETTLRELGNQAVVTAGKFGGWTVAASALFGAATAVQRVGQGAMDASSGVHTLQRVITDGFDTGEAQQQFQSMAQEFNVPIATVVDAVYRMGQRFHTLPEAVSAARASLYSFKTGEVDVGTSTTNLIAIVNGFGLSTQRLSQVYDQINQAQNVFGVSIGDTESGLAKAAGTFHQAGGDLDYLLGLMVAINRATSRPGTEIGTAISRGVQQIRKPSAQATLEALGVDVDPNNIQKTIQSAMRQAQAGIDPNALAAGLFGNQYARLIAPVLADQDTLNKALSNTTPEKSKGSAQRELAKVLAEAGERIKALGVDLETLGAALAEAGVFTIPGAFLDGLDKALDLVNGLVNAFNHLVPPDLRPFVSSLAEAGAAIALIRRFGGFERLAQRNPAFLPLVNQDRRIQIRASRGLRDQASEAMNYQENLARRQLQQRIDVEASRNRAAAFESTYRQRERSGTLPRPDTDARVAIERERESLNMQFLNAERNANLTAEQINHAKLVAITAERELAELQKLHYREVRGWLMQRGIQIPAELGTPNLRGGADVRGGRAWPVAQGVQQFARPMEQYSAPIGPAPQGVRGVEQYSRPIDPGSGRGRRDRAIYRVRETLAKIVQRDAEDVNALGKSYRVVESGAQRLNAVTAGLGQRATRANGLLRSGARRMGSVISSLTSGFGVFDYALITWMAGQEIIDRILEGQKRRVEGMDRQATGQQGTTGEMRQAMNAAAERAQRLIREGNFGDELEVAASTSNRLTTELQAQRKAPITSGRHNFLLASDTIQKQAEAIRQRFKDGEATQFMLDSAITTAIEDVRGSAVIPDKNKGAIISALSNMTSNRQVQKNALAQLNADQQKAASEAAVSQAQVFGGTPANMRRIVDTYRAQMTQYEGKTDDASIKELNSLRIDFYNAIDQQVQADITFGQSQAQTERQRRSVYTRALTGYRRSILAPARNRSDKAQTDLAAARRRQEQADLALAAAEGNREATTRRSTGPLDPGVIAGLPTDTSAARDAAAKAKREVDRLKKERDAADEELRAAERVYKEKRADIRRAALEDRQQGRDLDASVTAARSPDENVQAQAQLRAAEANLRDARRSGFGPRSREYRQALQAVFQARQQVAQAMLSSVEAENAMIQAQAGLDPVSQANAALTSAQNTLNAMSGKQRARFSGDDRKKARADVITAQKQRDEAVRQEAIDEAQLEDQISVARAGGDPVEAARRAQQAARRALASARNRKERLQATLDLVNANNDMEEAIQDIEAARADYLQTTTTDPVEQARIAERQANKNVKGKTGAARYRAMADRNRARQTRLDAELAGKEDDIEFERDMGRLSVQGAIDRYQELLKIKTLTKAQRRDIQRRIKALQDEGEQEASGFDLDVGSIKLPTVYDVRKAWDPVRDQVRRQGGDHRQAARATQQRQSASDLDTGVGRQTAGDLANNVTTNATVNIYVADKNAAPEVYAQLDRALKTRVRAKMRSKGKRG